MHVEPYCKDCIAFEADVHQIWFDGKCEHHIMCANKDKCEAIYLHLKKKIKKGEDKDD
jgi:hypothetical protein